LLATLVFAGEETTGQWEVRENTEVVALATWQELFLNRTFEHTVLGLHANQWLDPQCPGHTHGVRHLPGGKIGTANVADLPLLHQSVHGAQGFLHGCERVIVVDLIEVQVIGLESLQSEVDLINNVLA
jgi:hypothetical protein